MRSAIAAGVIVLLLLSCNACTPQPGANGYSFHLDPLHDWYLYCSGEAVSGRPVEACKRHGPFIAVVFEDGTCCVVDTRFHERDFYRSAAELKADSNYRALWSIEWSPPPGVKSELPPTIIATVGVITALVLAVFLSAVAYLAFNIRKPRPFLRRLPSGRWKRSPSE